MFLPWTDRGEKMGVCEEAGAGAGDTRTLLLISLPPENCCRNLTRRARFVRRPQDKAHGILLEAFNACYSVGSTSLTKDIATYVKRAFDQAYPLFLSCLPPGPATLHEMRARVYV